jgi:hypothetical protein
MDHNCVIGVQVDSKAIQRYFLEDIRLILCPIVEDLTTVPISSANFEAP